MNPSPSDLNAYLATNPLLHDAASHLNISLKDAQTILDKHTELWQAVIRVRNGK